MSAVIDRAVVGAQPLGYSSDEALIARLRANDDEAFATLVTRYERQLLAFCRRMLGSREDAEDVLQDTFAAAYKAILADDRVIDCRPWLYQIARNRCLNAIRGRHQSQPLGLEGLECEAPLGTVEQVARRVELNLLVGDIQSLPAQQRQALVLHELEGCSYEEIAHHLGASVASVRSLLLRARRSLLAVTQGRALACADIRLALSGSSSPSAAVRRHLESCSECAKYRRGLKRRPAHVLRALSPLGALAALKNLLLGRALRQAAPTGAAGASAAGAGGASLGAGGAVTAGAGVSGAVLKGLAGLAVLAAAGTGTVVSQQAPAGRHHARPTTPVVNAPVSAPAQSVPVVIPSSRPPAASPPRRASASKAATGPTPATPSTSSTSQPPPPTTPGSTGTQGSQSGVQTPTSPTAAARTRPVSGAGMMPARTRPLPAEAPYSQGTSTGNSSTGTGSQTGASGTTTTQTSASTDTSRNASEQGRRPHRGWRRQSQF